MTFSPPYFYVGLAEDEASEEFQRKAAEEAEKARLEVIESEYATSISRWEKRFRRPLTATEKRVLLQTGSPFLRD
jgi:hypothetical protein